MPYDKETADQIVRAWAELAVHIKGPLAGQPAPLMPWQEVWIRQLYGTLDEEGKRQFRTVFILQPKKIGKTYVAAMICLLMLSVYGQFGSEVFSLANSKEQASEVFKAAHMLVELSPAFQEMEFEVRPSTKEIRLPSMRSRYKALAADSDNLHGLGPAALVVDELHAMKNRKAVDAVREGMANWDEPLTVYITNMAALDESVPFWEELEYAKKVRDGQIIDPEYLPFITEAPAHLTDDELLEEGPHWQQINPALGTLVKVDFLRRACREAKEKPSQRGETLRLHLCRASQSAEAAVPMHLWDAAKVDDLTEDQMIGRRCAVGIDLSSHTDLTSVSAVFPESDDGRTWLSWSWVPSERITALEKLTGRPIRQWVEDPNVPLFSTPGPTIQYSAIEAFCRELQQTYNVAGFVYDPKFANQLSQNLTTAGLEMIEFQASWRAYTEPWEATEGRIARKAIQHRGDPVLQWAAMSLVIKRSDEGLVKPSKPNRKIDERRIDPFVACLMAESLLIHMQELPPVSVDDLVFG